MHNVADPDHLRRILTNLWENSRERAASHPVRLRIAARSDGEQVTIELSDNGPGIPTDVVEHVFEPFFTTRSSGTGLGLYLARELARNNGGHLDLVSARPGARFQLQLPAGHSVHHETLTA